MDLRSGPSGHRPDRGDLLVAAQVSCMGAAVFWPGEAQWRVPRLVRLLAVGAVAVGTGLSFAGATSLGRHLRPHPRPAAGAALRTDGIYARMRHPIYAGVLLAAGGSAVLRARPEPLVAAAALAGVFQLKARYEEALLRDRFGVEYDAYVAEVPRFIPRVLRP